MPPSRRTSARAKVSSTSELLPEPLTPVMQTRAESGNRTLTHLRLLTVAPSRLSERGLAMCRRLQAGESLPAGQIAAGERFARGHFAGRALSDDAAAMTACPRTHVHEPISLAHDRFIVFDHDDRIAARLQISQRAISRSLLRGCRPIDGSSST